MNITANLQATLRAVAVLAAAGVVAAMAMACGSDAVGDAAAGCIGAEEQASSYRLTLVTVWNGQPEFLPANIGIEDDCIRPLHTIADDSYVYVAGDAGYTLGHFFDIWEDNPSTRPNAAVENVSLNGQRHEGDYRDIVLSEEQRIVVAFGDRGP